MSERVFVYGTLKRGLENAYYLNGQIYLGEARTEDCYRLWDCGGYPGMRPVTERGRHIRGEVWEIDAACRARLDILEDVALGLYTYEPVRLLSPFDNAGVYTYIYQWSIEGRADAGDVWGGDS